MEVLFLRFVFTFAIFIYYVHFLSATHSSISETIHPISNILQLGEFPRQATPHATPCRRNLSSRPAAKFKSSKKLGPWGHLAKMFSLNAKLMYMITTFFVMQKFIFLKVFI